MAKHKNFIIDASAALEIFDDLSEYRDVPAYYIGAVDFPKFLDSVSIQIHKSKQMLMLSGEIASSITEKDMVEYFNLEIPVDYLRKNIRNAYVSDVNRDELMGDICVVVVDGNETGTPDYVVRAINGDILLVAGDVGGLIRKMTTQDEFMALLLEFSSLFSVLIEGVFCDNNQEISVGQMVLGIDSAKQVETANELGLYTTTSATTDEEDETKVQKSADSNSKKPPIDATKSVMSSLPIERRPSTTFEDIGGCRQAKKAIMHIADAIACRDIFKKWGTFPSRGILLYGPSGTGKTTLVKALANRSNSAFFYIKLSDMFNMWVGETEKNIARLFKEARQNSPSIIFIDELDALADNRDFAHESTKQAIAEILAQIDGLDSSGNVTFVAATNRVDTIDPAFLRPGRIDLKIFIDLPNEEDRKEIFKIFIDRAERVAERKLFKDDLNYRDMSSRTEKKSGADIEEIVRRVLDAKVMEEINSKVEPELVSQSQVIQTIINYTSEEHTRFKKKIGFTA